MEVLRVNHCGNKKAVFFIYLQVTNFWTKVLSEEEKTRLVENIAGHLKDAAEFIQKRAVSLLLFCTIRNACCCIKFTFKA